MRTVGPATLAAALFAVATALGVRVASAVVVTRVREVASPPRPPAYGGCVPTLLDAAVNALQAVGS